MVEKNDRSARRNGHYGEWDGRSGGASFRDAYVWYHRGYDYDPHES